MTCLDGPGGSFFFSPFGVLAERWLSSTEVLQRDKKAFNWLTSSFPAWRLLKDIHYAGLGDVFMHIF